ncbi:hypothetical protein ACHAWU_010310 [Discostella pseudostelligera]|uniref:DDE Tnp4 domain-containing protein n=1 Tax=Discostella pseudostelligera TaxID=259834 RepID=A0ABD3N248_9STRA
MYSFRGQCDEEGNGLNTATTNREPGSGEGSPHHAPRQQTFLMPPWEEPRAASLSQVQRLDTSIMTSQDILAYGLMYVGFGRERQNVCEKTSVDRFKAHYGPDPWTVKDLMTDLINEFPSTCFKELLMGLNWLKLYDVEAVLAGRWGYSEVTCREKCRATVRHIQSFKEKMIRFDPSLFRSEETHIISVDCVNFITEEFRLNPSTEYFDHKSHSCGLKYQFAISIWRDHCVSINGPYPAGKYHDKALFCGAETMDESSDRWDRSALYFQIPDGKKAIGDSAYEGAPEKVTVKREGHPPNVFEFLDRAQNRQESYHSRLENYNILTHRFRHGKSTQDKMNLHKMAVEAVAVIVEYDMRYHPLFEVF